MEQKNELKVKDLGQVAINNMLKQVVSYANLENVELTTKEKQYAVGIITNINKRVVSDSNLSWAKLDIQGCQLPAQIKRYARLNLQMESQEIFLDIRNNGKTGLKDINIKMQYQGLEKLMTTYCGKKIVRYYKDVVCKGDKIVRKPNLATGLLELKDHEYFETDNIDYRNKLENIIGAYAIAYVEENNKLIPYVAYIDKNRIERGRKAATTQNIWDNDTRKMVTKTAVWELFNIMKPFMVMPQDLVKDLNDISNEEVDFNNKDYINATVEEVNENVENNIASEDIEVVFDNYNVEDEYKEYREYSNEEIFND